MPKSFYSFAKISSYNATYNGVIGARGLGKTYGKKVKVVKDAIRKGDMFIYLRRYKPELMLSKNTFFADIEHLFPQYDFRANGYIAQYAPVSTRTDKKRPWVNIGYFIALSTAQSFKSVSFAKVKTIIYDEFIIEKGLTHYLPDEAKVFNNFYSTVDRYQDKTRVWFLANSVAVNNPYFIEYEVEPRHADDNGFIIMADGFMVWHFPDSKDFENEVYQTAFGKFIQGTEYADYAVGNEFADDGENLIKAKSPRAIYMYSLETKKGTFAIWHDIDSNEYYCGSRRVGNEKMYTLIPERMNSDKILLVRNDKLLQMLRTAFNHGRMWFDRASTRNSLLEIFK